MVLSYSILRVLEGGGRPPQVRCVRVAFPFDEIFKSALISGLLAIHDGLHHVFLLVVNQLRWFLRVVGAVFRRLHVWGEELSVEDWMNTLPSLGNVEAETNGRFRVTDDLRYGEWSMSLGVKFGL